MNKIRKLISGMIIIVLVICMAGCSSSNNMADSAVKAAKEYGIEEVADLGELFKVVTNTSAKKSAFLAGEKELAAKAYEETFNSSNSLPQKEIEKYVFIVVYENGETDVNRSQCAVVNFKEKKDAREIYEKCKETLILNDGVSHGEDKGMSYIFERYEKSSRPIFRAFYLKDNCVIRYTSYCGPGENTGFSEYFLNKMGLKS